MLHGDRLPIGDYARSSASLNKFDMRVDRTSLDNPGSVYSNSTISKLLIIRWICHSQNFQDLETVHCVSLLHQPANCDEIIPCSFVDVASLQLWMQLST